MPGVASTVRSSAAHALAPQLRNSLGAVRGPDRRASPRRVISHAGVSNDLVASRPSRLCAPYTGDAAERSIDQASRLQGGAPIRQDEAHREVDGGMIGHVEPQDLRPPEQQRGLDLRRVGQECRARAAGRAGAAACPPAAAPTRRARAPARGRRSGSGARPGCALSSSCSSSGRRRCSTAAGTSGRDAAGGEPGRLRRATRYKKEFVSVAHHLKPAAWRLKRAAGLRCEKVRYRIPPASSNECLITCARAWRPILERRSGSVAMASVSSVNASTSPTGNSILRVCQRKAPGPRPGAWCSRDRVRPDQYRAATGSGALPQPKR